MLRAMTIPNWVSLYRIIAAPVLLLVAFFGNQLLFFWLLLISFSTDVLDGFLARQLDVETDFGTRLDSIGDLSTNAVAAFGVVWFKWGFVQEYFIFLLLMVSLYVLEVLLALWKYGSISSFHTILCKAASIAQGVFIVTLLSFVGFVPWLFYPTFIISVASNIEEIIILFLSPRGDVTVKGLYWYFRDH